MAFRISIPDFSLANPMYVGASVFLYGVDENGDPTDVLATLYANPTGTVTMPNPQTLDSEGKFQFPVYIETPVIAEVIGATVGTHTTGAIGVRGTWRGGWTTDTVYYSTDIIEDPVSRDLYVATLDYTSGASLAEDVADGSLQFQLYAVAAVATSASSNSIGTGSKVFETQANRQFGFGQTLVIVDRANSANFMIGKVTSYVGETLTVAVTLIGGSGTKTDWEISISGPAGAAGNGVPIGGTTGQVLQKSSATDYATSWLTLGAAAAQALGADITTDGTNLTSRMIPVQKLADYVLAADDRNKLFYFYTNTVALTATCLHSATAGVGYTAKFVNQFASTKPLILAVASGNGFYHPNGTNSATLTLQPGESCSVYSTGDGYFVLELIRNKTAIQGGFKNLKIVAADGTTAPVVTADQVTVEDTSGRAMRLSSLSVTMNLGTIGAGGIDVAPTIAAAKMYFIWAIAKEDGTQSTLASLSSTAPTLPTDYTMKARIGTVVTKQGAATLLGTLQYGRRVQYAQPQTIASGTQGTYSATAPTWAAKTVAANSGASAFVPLTASQIVLSVNGNLGNATSQFTYAAPNSGYGGYQSSNPPPFVAGVNNGSMEYGPMILEATTIQVIGNGTQSAIYCNGWEENL